MLKNLTEKDNTLIELEQSHVSEVINTFIFYSYAIKHPTPLKEMLIWNTDSSTFPTYWQQDIAIIQNLHSELLYGFWIEVFYNATLLEEKTLQLLYQSGLLGVKIKTTQTTVGFSFSIVNKWYWQQFFTHNIDGKYHLLHIGINTLVGRQIYFLHDGTLLGKDKLSTKKVKLKSELFYIGEKEQTYPIPIFSISILPALKYSFFKTTLYPTRKEFYEKQYGITIGE